MGMLAGLTKIVKRLHLIACVLLGFSLPHSVMANPSDGNVISGNATITQSGSQTTINQTTDKAIIEWGSFNIGANEATLFQQPNSSAIALNRVLGSDPSVILGTLTANGQIILINPAGVIFGAGSRVDVGGLIASTANLSNQDFLANNFHFVQSNNYPNGGYIINNGLIKVRDGSYVALVGKAVENNGIIQANLGKVMLGAGTDYIIDVTGDGLINFTANTKVLDKVYDLNGNPIKDSVSNKGTITANGGKVLLAANTAKETVDNAINNQGIIEARSAAKVNGEIVLLGGDEGTVNVSGTLDASGEQGGKIKVLGKNIRLASATLKADGDKGGGEILVGGDYQGGGILPRAYTVSIDPNSYLYASALSQGNGGRIIVWSDYRTDYAGNLFAKGGALSGNGGFAEVSGKQFLNFTGKVNLNAPYGTKGTLLLDPYDITIQSSGSTVGSFSNGVYTSNNNSSILLISDLQNALANANVTIFTGSNGSEAGNITVANALSWSNANSLTLNAHNNVIVNAAISNSGGGSLTLRSDYDSNGSGTVVFNPGGSVTFSGGGSVNIYYNPTTTTPHKYNNAIDYTSYITGVTPTAAMLVNNLLDLRDMSENLAGSYVLGTDIDASATATWNPDIFTHVAQGFKPIGSLETGAFTGTFIGNKHTISNLTINRGSDDYVGLFGYTSGSTINTLFLANANITGAANVGGVVGSNGGTLENIRVSGTITGDDRVGGLAGSTTGNVTNTFSSALVNGSNDAGGLVGRDFGGTHSNNFWDMNTSGIDESMNTSGIGSGKTTSESMQQATFTGWNFTTIWSIIENSTYPSFQPGPTPNNINNTNASSTTTIYTVNGTSIINYLLPNKTVKSEVNDITTTATPSTQYDNLITKNDVANDEEDKLSNRKIMMCRA